MDRLVVEIILLTALMVKNTLIVFFFASMFHAGNGKIETRDYQEPKQVRNGNSNFHCDELFEIDFREICLNIKCSSPSWRCLFFAPAPFSSIL